VVVQYYLYRLPWIAVQVMPVAVLLASLVSLGTLARHNEVLAMKLGQMSTLRIVAPVLLLGLLASLAVVALGESVVPTMNERAQALYLVKVKKAPAFQRTRDNDIWYRARGNRFLHLSAMETVSGTVEGLTLFELSNEFDLIRRVDAREARWKNGRWLAKDGYVSMTRPDGTYETRPFATLTLDLEEAPSDLARVVREPEEMTSAELREYIARLARSGVNVLRYRVDLAAKTATAFVSLVMALIGIAFALRTGKGGVAAWSGACVLVGFCYWIVLSFSLSLGRGGLLPPQIAAWLPNVLFAAAGLASLLTVKT
jgi:lipopolysaccharide export system permease protein